MRLHRPAGRALHVEQRGARQGCLDRRLVAAVDIGDGNAVAREQRLEQAVGVGIDDEIAAMPLPKARPSSAPSMAATFSSKMRTVGFRPRL
jgi:hypothetical protein